MLETGWEDLSLQLGNWLGCVYWKVLEDELLCRLDGL